jgi:hypothetical protein
MSALGRKPPSEDEYKAVTNGPLEDVMDFGKIFRKFGITGKYAGGLRNLGTSILNGSIFLTDDDAFNLVFETLLNGKMAFMGIDSKKVNNYMATKNNASYESSGYLVDNHLIRIVALHLDMKGSVNSMSIYDTTGYARLYKVPFDVLKDAYNSFFAVAAHGIFLTDAQAFQPIRIGHSGGPNR